MSISTEALQKLVLEIEAQSAAAQQQINLVRTQLSAKQREVRMAQLTSKEMSSIPADTQVYEGVGKMFVSTSVSSMKNKLDAQIAARQAEADALNKKLLYLETTRKNSQQHIDQLLKQGHRNA